MTEGQRRRTQQALAETQRFIDRESARPADTRPADMKQHLEFCIKHKAKLIEMLAQ